MVVFSHLAESQKEKAAGDDALYMSTYSQQIRNPTLNERSARKSHLSVTNFDTSLALLRSD